MLTIENYEKILNEGLILDHYFLLCNIHEGKEVAKSKRIDGFINLLTRKGYIIEGILTEKAMQVIEIPEETQLSVSTTTTQSKQIDFAAWVIQVYNKCQAKIKELVGTKQVRAQIKGGKSYPFLCNATDLANVLTRVITRYKLKDFDAIEKCMVGHIERCKREKDWFPLMKYYILKDGQSMLVTELDSVGEEKTVIKSTQKHI